MYPRPDPKRSSGPTSTCSPRLGKTRRAASVSNSFSDRPRPLRANIRAMRTRLPSPSRATAPRSGKGRSSAARRSLSIRPWKRARSRKAAASRALPNGASRSRRRRRGRCRPRCRPARGGNSRTSRAANRARRPADPGRGRRGCGCQTGKTRRLRHARTRATSAPHCRARPRPAASCFRGPAPISPDAPAHRRPRARWDPSR